MATNQPLVVPVGVDYFTSPTFTSVYKSTYTQELSPVTGLQDENPIEFNIQGLPNTYTDLNDTKLELKLKIIKGADTDLADGDLAGVVNNFFHSLFKNIEVKIGNSTITDSNPFYPYISYLKKIIGCSGEVLKQRGKI